MSRGQRVYRHVSLRIDQIQSQFRVPKHRAKVLMCISICVYNLQPEIDDLYPLLDHNVSPLDIGRETGHDLLRL